MIARTLRRELRVPEHVVLRAGSEGAIFHWAFERGVPVRHDSLRWGADAQYQMVIIDLERVTLLERGLLFVWYEPVPDDVWDVESRWVGDTPASHTVVPSVEYNNPWRNTDPNRYRK